MAPLEHEQRHKIRRERDRFIRQHLSARRGLEKKLKNTTHTPDFLTRAEALLAWSAAIGECIAQADGRGPRRDTVTTKAGTASEMRKLEQAIKQNKHKLAPTGGGHKKVLRPNGQVVKDMNGPVILSGSPSDVRWRTMTVRRLMKTDPPVIAFDPWNPPENRGDGKATPTDAQVATRERLQRAQAEASRKRAERTRKIRARLEPLIVQIGGSWGKKGFSTELAMVAKHLLDSKGRVESWASLNAAQVHLSALARGATASDEKATAWEIVLDDIEDAYDPRERYFQLLREAKGLPAKAKEVRVPEKKPRIQIDMQPEVEEEPEVWPPEVDTTRVIASPIKPLEEWQKEREAARLATIEIPTLALRVLYGLARGVSMSGMTEEQCLEVAEEVLRLELATIRELSTTTATTKEEG